MNEDRIKFHAKQVGVRRSQAVRIEYFLEKIHKKALVHDDVRVMPVLSGECDFLVMTVDPDNGDMGCAECGELAREKGDEKFREGFKSLHLAEVHVPKSCPLEHVAILYCVECVEKHLKWFEHVLGEVVVEEKRQGRLRKSLDTALDRVLLVADAHGERERNVRARGRSDGFTESCDECDETGARGRQGGSLVWGVRQGQ